MSGYYTSKLAAQRLRACYEVAPPAVHAYLEAEIDFVLKRLSPRMTLLELGCGYGRVLRHLAPVARASVGIDTSEPSLRLAREFLGDLTTASIAVMDATRMGFADRIFDLTICIQNGISAFGVDARTLYREAVRVTRTGGTVLFSSYAPSFWESRLEWFRVQAAHGLIGEIDENATGDGVIVCRDGFRARTFGREDFVELAAGLGLAARVQEVAASSLFCEVTVV
jgi:2-polyprenyl-6-hydroxyphenyl methylase/3-demethylubiquinone-9 3-methyltransferase